MGGQDFINYALLRGFRNGHVNLFQEVASSPQQIDQRRSRSYRRAAALARRAHGRLFFLGVGGSAGNCGHAGSTIFSKLCGIECTRPKDNVSEPTARTPRRRLGHQVFGGLAENQTPRTTKRCGVRFSVGRRQSGEDVSRNIVAG